MKIKTKLYSIAFSSAFLILFLILISSTASASTVQNSSSNGPFAYITNYGNNNVSVFDMANNTVTATVPVGIDPNGVAVTPDGTKVYVANGNVGSDFGTVSVIDAATNTVIATVPVGNT
jgi:40-residue YVTN family beta-propeller repeat